MTFIRYASWFFIVSVLAVVAGDRTLRAQTASTSYTAPSIAALKALTTRPAVVVVVGANPGSFNWSTTPCGAADDIFQVTPTSGPGGCYIRMGTPYVTASPGVTESIVVGNGAGAKIYALNVPMRSIAIGNHALGGASLLGAAAENVAVGHYSQEATTSGWGNASLGSATLPNNTTGHWNAAVGAFSMFHNTTGFWSTANGFQSLYSNTTGNNSTALGTFALFQNTSASDNTAVGMNALQSVTDGDTSVAVGANTLYRNSSSVATLGSITGGSGYTNGTYSNVRATVVSGYPVTPANNPAVNWFPNWPIEGAPAILPRLNIVVSGGAVTSATIVSNAFTALSWSVGTVTATTTTPHGITAGKTFVVSGASPSAYNGFYTATSGTAGSTLKYAKAVDPGAATSFGKLDGSGFSVSGPVVNPGYPTNALTSLSWSGGVATATTTTVPHGVATGQTFTISGASPAGYNGTYIATTGTTASTLAWVLASNPGTATVLGQLNGVAPSNVPGTVLGVDAADVGGTGSGFSVPVATVAKGRVNTAIGPAAGNGGLDGTMSTASELTAVGGYSQQEISSGNGNTSVGAYSLFRASAGSYNTALGTSNAASLTTGAHNITIGAYVDVPSVTGNSQLNIGNVLFGTAMYGGTTNSSTPIAGKIGIGVVPTTHALEVNGLAKSAAVAPGTLDDTLATAAYAGSAWTPFTPVLTCGSGTLTSGSATGRYKQMGKFYAYSIQIVIPTNGTCATYLAFTLPNGSTPIAPGAGSAFSAAPAAATGSVSHVNASNNAFIFKYDGTYPAVDGSQIRATGFYEAN